MSLAGSAPAFLTDLDLRAIGQGRWLVLAPFKVRSAVLEADLSVPQGFETDLASVPRLPFVYWTVGARARKGATVHDYLYQFQPVSRQQADAVFYELAALEEGTIVAGLMWSGVRIGGWITWRRHATRRHRFDNARVERRATEYMLRAPNPPQAPWKWPQP
mgnify:CR=1 FL=1